MRTSTAYFAGVGTVVAAIAVGVGGGFTIANVVNPHESKQEVSRLDRRTAGEQTGPPSASSQPAPYLAATQDAATKPVTVAPAPPQSEQPQQQSAQPNNPPAAQPEAPPAQDAQPPSPPAQATQAAAREPSASPERSNANASTRDADVKRAAAEKRRAERHQRWAERRRGRQDDDMRGVERSVRQATESPRLIAVEAPRRIELFDDGDD
ncbi:MAG: hypothetical protein V7632_5160 [Bradyrhizobium sp.]|jgi:hypothetical protein